METHEFCCPGMHALKGGHVVGENDCVITVAPGGDCGVGAERVYIIFI